ncbi:MAG: DUF302 domain-containing protein [Ichthyobacteriaceae bacterium]|nr:DUF302 domain-containing protein [Ichthyobacteriaceae bacterium]
MEKKILVIVSILGGLILGVFFTGLALNMSSGNMMLKEIKSPYEFDKTVEVIQNNINAQDGWSVTGLIDQNKAVQAGGGAAIGNFKIVKYCHGKLASEMLEADNRKKIGAMMHKSFAVYEKSNGQVYISTANGAIMGKLFGGEASEIMERVALDVEAMMAFVNLKFNVF